MFLTLQANDKSPLYQQITDGIKALIAGGNLREGVALPSVRQVAGDLGVNLNTVAAAYRQLQDEGFVTVRHGAGAVIASRTSRPVDGAELYRPLRTALTQLVLSGLSGREIEETVRQELALLQQKGGARMSAPTQFEVMVLVTTLVVLTFAYSLVKFSWNQPLRNGPGFFLGVEVPEGFYDGPGRAWLKGYRATLVALHLLLVVCFGICFALRRLDLAAPVLGGWACPIATAVLAFDAWTRHKLGANPPVRSVALSLETRRLGDYISWPMEALMLRAMIASSLVGGTPPWSKGMAAPAPDDMVRDHSTRQDPARSLQRSTSS